MAGGISSSDGSGGSVWSSSRNREADRLDQWQLGSAAVTAVVAVVGAAAVTWSGPVGPVAGGISSSDGSGGSGWISSSDREADWLEHW